ncbi:tetratricopeptide repeat protein [Arhodomonas sp. SL1]|uniref:tetratricopeptide repeat protein n=1 Tax=Arhodomonas sp. SL1 TaxID=3425691 RepID=UPI003F883DEE
MVKHSRRHGIARAVTFALLAPVLLAGCATLTAGPGREAADAAYEANQWRSAARGYQRYLERAPRDPHAWYRLGNARTELGELPAAERAYQAALETAPELARARHNLGLVQLRMAVENLLGAREGLPADARREARTRRLATCLLEGLERGTLPSACPNGNEGNEEQR